jgi:hypothetical protein
MPSRVPRRRRGAPAGLAVALFALVTTACVCRPETEDWQAAGAAPFRTPAAAFRTFKTAVGGDDVALEFRCFSSAFRRREGISQLVYREFRERLLKEKPWLARISCATVVEETRLDEGRAEVTAEVQGLFQTVRLRIGFVREDFYELHSETELVGDDGVRLEEVVRPTRSRAGEDGLELWLPLPPGRTADEVSLIVVGREWKIDSLSASSDAEP